MLDHGIARAGYLEIPRDRDLAFHLLEVHWRTVHHYGVQIHNRIYRVRVLLDYVGVKSPYTEHGGAWPVHVNPDDIRQIYFYDLKNTRRWHRLVWTEATKLDAPMSEDGLRFARQLARSKHPEFDDKLALAELLERRNLGLGRTPVERRAALRVSREQSTLDTDLAAAINVAALPTARRVLEGFDPQAAAEDEAARLDDDLEEVPFVGTTGVYDDVLEDL